MILGEQILRLVRTRLATISALTDSYPYMAPDEAVHPFATISQVSTVPYYTFTTNMEDIRVQVSVFDDNPTPQRVVTILNDIERDLVRQHYPMPDEDDGVNEVCCHKSNEFLRYLETDHLWQGIIEFIFICEMDKDAFPESSSSESSESSSQGSSLSSLSSLSSKSSSSKSSSSSSKSKSSLSSLSSLSSQSSYLTPTGSGFSTYPDCNGAWHYVGEFAGRPLYKNGADNRYLGWGGPFGLNTWLIGDGVLVMYYSLYPYSTDPAGNYYVYGGGLEGTMTFA